MSNNDNRLDSALVRSLHLQIADEMTAHRQRREVRREPPLSRGDEEQFAMSLMQAAVSRHMQSLLSRGQELPDPSYEAQYSGSCHRGQSSGSVGLGLKWSFVTHWPGQAALS